MQTTLAEDMREIMDALKYTGNDSSGDVPLELETQADIIRRELEKKGYTDPDIIEFEIERALGTLQRTEL